MNKKDIEDKVNTFLTTGFNQYDSNEVPDIENGTENRLTLGNTGIYGEFTFLYVDMRGSSSYTDQHRLQTITKIYKAYHHCMVECIKQFNGKIRSFDGDRVLAVFSGERKVNNAVECAMKIVGCKYDILKPKINSAFNNNNFSLGVGISTGNIMVSKAGTGYDKNNRDLIWIGDPPNLGAKLSDEADSPNSIYICKTTFGRLKEVNQFTTRNGVKIDMWTSGQFKFKNEFITIYKTGYYRSL
ncbi:adenylate/guanylate cyclase domain-containing protein [Flavobacterium koreense]